MAEAKCQVTTQKGKTPRIARNRRHIYIYNLQLAKKYGMNKRITLLEIANKKHNETILSDSYMPSLRNVYYIKWLLAGS